MMSDGGEYDEVPAWMSEQSLPSAEDVRIEEAIGDERSLTVGRRPNRTFQDYNTVARGRCRRFVMPCTACFLLVVLVAGISMGITGKGPIDLADEAEDFLKGTMKAGESENAGGKSMSVIEGEPETPVMGGSGDAQDQGSNGSSFGNEEYGLGSMEDFILSSPEFGDGDLLPNRYTATGEGLSPPLVWSGVPMGTGSLLLIFDEPSSADETGEGAEGETRVQWVLYGIPPYLRELPGRIPNKFVVTSDDLGGGGATNSDPYELRQGLNYLGKQAQESYEASQEYDYEWEKAVGYAGPQPPRGVDADDYYFRMFALMGDITLDLKPDWEEVDRGMVLDSAMDAGIIAEVTLRVTVEKQ